MTAKQEKHVLQFAKFIGINEREAKQTKMPANENYIGDHRVEQTNMVAKCKIFLTVT